MPSPDRHLVLKRECVSHRHTPGCGRTIVPFCTARTAPYHFHLVCIPPFPTRKILPYCHPNSVFSKYPYTKVWTDDSSFLLCKYGVLLRSSNAYTSIPLHAKPCYIIIRSQNLPCEKFEKIKISFSPNAQSLPFWKTSLTQNWKHSTVFVILIISFRKCTYATSCKYVLSHRSGIVPVSISVPNNDITCLGGHFTCT